MWDRNLTCRSCSRAAGTMNGLKKKKEWMRAELTRFWRRCRLAKVETNSTRMLQKYRTDCGNSDSLGWCGIESRYGNVISVRAEATGYSFCVPVMRSPSRCATTRNERYKVKRYTFRHIAGKVPGCLGGPVFQFLATKNWLEFASEKKSLLSYLRNI